GLRALGLASAARPAVAGHLAVRALDAVGRDAEVAGHGEANDRGARVVLAAVEPARARHAGPRPARAARHAGRRALAARGAGQLAAVGGALGVDPAGRPAGAGADDRAHAHLG